MDIIFFNIKFNKHREREIMTGLEILAVVTIQSIVLFVIGRKFVTK